VTISSGMLPWMDEGGLKFFVKVTALCECYLEYGCGGSTVYAANTAQIPHIISVDTDRNWIEKVTDLISNKNIKFYIEHCDLGEVGDWGMPLHKDKIDDFWMYMALPWHIAKEQNLTPDIVLIDGRFRVASFLYTLLAAQEGTTILFDDYLDRPGYFVVENFCRLQERHGRMGVFVVEKGFSYPEIVKRIAQYAIQPQL
jgi:hypothetical protein